MAEPIPFTDDDLDIAARTLYGEARGEPKAGQIGVLWVIRNRATWKPKAWWGGTLQDVCLKPWQFSCWNATDPNRAKLMALKSNDPKYQMLYGLAKTVMRGDYEDLTQGATCYEVTGTNAKWAQGRTPTVTLGAHEFYALTPQG